MATKKKPAKKGSRKTATLQEQIVGLIRVVEDDLGIAREQWNRYHEKGVKKGFKNARKAILQVKKGAMEIRKTMANIEL